MAAAEWKKALVKEYSKLIKDYNVVGVVDLRGIPNAQLLQIKNKLRGTAELRGGRKNLFKLAIEVAEKTKPGIKQLETYMDKSLPALIFTNNNPFALYQRLEKSKIQAPAKPGDIAPQDIVVKPGPTSFTPGPIISELAGVGIKTKVVQGKLEIQQEVTVVKEGEPINDKLSSILLRLDIKPIQIGLNIVAEYENGLVFDKKVLSIDEKEFMSNIIAAAKGALNLSLNAGIITKDTAELMISKAHNDGLALAREQNIMVDALVPEILAKAEAQMKALKALVPQTAPAVEEKKEEAKPEAEAKE